MNSSLDFVDEPNDSGERDEGVGERTRYGDD
jgi:hypothetical protein